MVARGGIEVMTFGLFPMNADVCRLAPRLRWELTNYRKPPPGLRYRLSRECRNDFWCVAASILASAVYICRIKPLNG